ncbi:hypothetical protein E2C01_021604 [Portunus trituberculatus]|uniref:Uncharacterized protein n=1 Tax=Portunus trituberculatus TaxID=210409 RepID=A0A5B7E353_PORTR|nr:hypothetical protein [Portunus trituberculatus]
MKATKTTVRIQTSRSRGCNITGVGVRSGVGGAEKGVTSGPFLLRYKDLMASSHIDSMLFISLTPSLRRHRPPPKGPTGVTQGAW